MTELLFNRTLKDATEKLNSDPGAWCRCDKGPKPARQVRAFGEYLYYGLGMFFGSSRWFGSGYREDGQYRPTQWKHAAFLRGLPSDYEVWDVRDQGRQGE